MVRCNYVAIGRAGIERQMILRDILDRILPLNPALSITLHYQTSSTIVIMSAQQHEPLNINNTILWSISTFVIISAFSQSSTIKLEVITWLHCVNVVS
jgi:hypothetical protein